MPNLLEAPPAKPPLPAAFLAHILRTPEQASAAGKRSAEAKRLRAAVKAGNSPANPEASPVEQAVNRQLDLVAEQITRTRAVLNDDTSDWCEHCERGGMQPHHRAQLLKALDSLLDRQRKLLGIPDPGSRRPAAEGKRGSAAPAAARGPWIPEQPQPQDASASSSIQSTHVTGPTPSPAPARPMGWEYDEPATSSGQP